MGTQLPQTAPKTTKSEKTVPAPAAFELSWSISLGSVDQPRLVSGSKLFFVATTDRQALTSQSTAAGSLSARALDDGHEVWAHPLRTDLAMAVSDDLLFVAEGDVVHAFDQGTGEERWHAQTGPLAIGPLWRSGWIFAAARDGALLAIRADDGSRVWDQGLGSPASAPPAIDGDRLFVPLSDGRLVALAISDKGAILWTSALGAAGTEPTAGAARVFLGDAAGVFHVIKQDNGRQDWPLHELIRNRIVGRPLLDGSRVILVTLDNRVLTLDRGSGTILWWQSLAARPGEQIGIDSGQVLVPLQSGDVSVRPLKTGLPETLFPSKLTPGNRLVPPLVITGPAGTPQVLRLTLASDGVLALSSFKRAVPPAAAPKAP